MLEAGFLILLAVVVGLADLSPALIVVVMTVGWLLVALIEYFAWRQTAGFPAVRQFATAEAAPPPDIVHEEVVEDMAPPPPPPPPSTPAAAPAEEETIVTPPRSEPPPAEPEEPADFRPQRLIIHRLEPLKPRPRRRWIIFGPYERREGDREEER